MEDKPIKTTIRMAGSIGPEILLKLPDNIKQWVVENASNPKVYIVAEFDVEILVGYVIAIDSIMPPISDYFTVLFCDMETKASFDEVAKIAKKNGAKQIVMIAKEMTGDLADLGFNQISVNVGRLV